MRQELGKQIAAVCQKLFNAEIDVELTRPEEQFGDYATNVALKLAAQTGKKPREIADVLAAELEQRLADKVSEISVAGPGFLNFKLADQALLEGMDDQPGQPLKGQTVVAEYSDPNPFKVLHAGHLYTSVVGDAIANLLEQAGAKVHRVNFGGDVGLHVGKTLWAIIDEFGGENPDKLSDIPAKNHAEWMAGAYVKGTRAYEEDEQAKAKIIEYNKRVYQLHADDDKDSPFAKIYWTCRQWSYDYFDAFYERIGSHFEKYYPESLTVPIGLETVRGHIGDVYEQNDGAVIFDGEKYGLHTRVFINSEGLPTYEAKDVGLMVLKKQDYDFDRSVVITGNEQAQYMAVVLKSVEQFAPELTKATTHLTHGIVKLKGGVKMSSREGNFLKAEDIFVHTNLAISNSFQEVDTEPRDRTAIAAVKYSFLKSRMGGDLIYDPKESVSLEGNSGPYLQYAHARACSILKKAGETGKIAGDLQAGERSLVRKISEYPEVVDKAVAELMPHHICTYLYELAQVFNHFYEHNRVIGDERQDLRLGLVDKYSKTLKHGLELLGIAAPERM